MTENGLTPDQWQVDMLRSWSTRKLLNCGRQTGKSLVDAAIAIYESLIHFPSLTLILSPTLRQSGELFRQKVIPLYHSLKVKPRITQATALTLTLENGSRIVACPQKEGNVRVYTVDCLILDEASRILDPLYHAVTPMLATTNGSIVGSSTPFGMRGWFYESWIKQASEWEKVEFPASRCHRISERFLASERAALGKKWFAQEYLCSFEDTIDAAFAEADIRAAIRDDIQSINLL